MPRPIPGKKKNYQAPKQLPRPVQSEYNKKVEEANKLGAQASKSGAQGLQPIPLDPTDNMKEEMPDDMHELLVKRKALMDAKFKDPNNQIRANTTAIAIDRQIQLRAKQELMDQEARQAVANEAAKPLNTQMMDELASEAQKVVTKKRKLPGAIPQMKNREMGVK